MLSGRSLIVALGALLLAHGATAQIAPIGTKGAYPDLAIDKNGNLHLVYGRSGKTYYRVLSKGSPLFGAEESTGVGASADHRQQPDVAIDSTGGVHVLGGSLYNRKIGTSWGSPQAPGISRDHHMAIDSNDRIWVVYRGGQVAVKSKLASASVWTGGTNIYTSGATDHIYPDITAGTDGSVHLVFRMLHPNNYDCGYLRYNGSTWSSVQWACKQGSPKMEEGPHIALDKNNIPHVAMPEGNLRYNRRVNGQWLTPVTVAAGAAHSRSEPTIAVDSAGNRYIGAWGGKIWIYNAGTQAWKQYQLPSVVPGGIGFVDVVKQEGVGAWMVYENSQGVNKTGAGAADLVVVRVQPDGTIQPYASTNNSGLSTTSTVVSASAGGTILYTMDGGTAEANKFAALLMSISGTTPGTALTNNGLLPLNLDPITVLSLQLANTPMFANFAVTLDGQGKAQATLTVARGFLRDLIGIKFHLAFLTFPVTDFASNSVLLQVGA